MWLEKAAARQCVPPQKHEYSTWPGPLGAGMCWAAHGSGAVLLLNAAAERTKARVQSPHVDTSLLSCLEERKQHQDAVLEAAVCACPRVPVWAAANCSSTGGGDAADCSPPGSSFPGDFPSEKTGVGCHFLL